MVLDLTYIHECNLIVDQASYLVVGMIRDVLEGKDFAICLPLDFEDLRLSAFSKLADNLVKVRGVISSEVCVLLEILFKLFGCWRLTSFLLLNIIWKDHRLI